MSNDIDEVDPVTGVDGCMHGRTTSDPDDLGPICCGAIEVGISKSGKMQFSHEVDPSCVHRCCRPA